jgi:hypothetical protein
MDPQTAKNRTLITTVKRFIVFLLDSRAQRFEGLNILQDAQISTVSAIAGLRAAHAYPPEACFRRNRESRQPRHASAASTSGVSREGGETDEGIRNAQRKATRPGLRLGGSPPSRG